MLKKEERERRIEEQAFLERLKKEMDDENQKKL